MIDSYVEYQDPRLFNMVMMGLSSKDTITWIHPPSLSLKNVSPAAKQSSLTTETLATGEDRQRTYHERPHEDTPENEENRKIVKATTIHGFEVPKKKGHLPRWLHFSGEVKT